MGGDSVSAAPVQAAAASPARAPRRALGWTLLALSLLGFLVAFYLTLVHYRGTILHCYVVHGCDTVQSSRYATVFGVPIALFGTVYFAAIFYGSVALMTTRSRAASVSYKALAYLGALAAVPLLLLQAVVLKAFCTYCIAVEVVLVLTWLGSLWMRTPERTTRT